jgi:hypothetical protein
MQATELDYTAGAVRLAAVVVPQVRWKLSISIRGKEME